jgi:hypothetical protein
VRRDGARNSHGRGARTFSCRLHASRSASSSFTTSFSGDLNGLSGISHRGILCVVSFAIRSWPDSGREWTRLAGVFSWTIGQSSDDIFFRHRSPLLLMPAHIQQDLAIIDRSLSTAGVSTAPASPDVHALRQSASAGRCDRQPPACNTTETVQLEQPLSQQSVNCLNVERNEHHKPPSSKREAGEPLCTFTSVKPIPGAQVIATCETTREHRQKEKLYHQSSIDANSPIKHRQNVTENPFLSLCPVISSCATYLRQSRYYITITTTASTLPRPDSIPCRDPDPSHRREGRDPLTINPSHVHRPVVAGRPPIIRSTEI